VVTVVGWVAAGATLIFYRLISAFSKALLGNTHLPNFPGAPN
jgi:hypothetical protein